MFKQTKRALGSLRRGVVRAYNACKSGLKIALVTASTAGGAAVMTGQEVMAQVSLPDTGVDVPAHIDAAIVILGTIVVAAIGGFFAFAVIKTGMRWWSGGAGRA